MPGHYGKGKMKKPMMKKKTGKTMPKKKKK